MYRASSIGYAATDGCFQTRKARCRPLRRAACRPAGTPASRALARYSGDPFLARAGRHSFPHIIFYRTLCAAARIAIPQPRRVIHDASCARVAPRYCEIHIVRNSVRATTRQRARACGISVPHQKHEHRSLPGQGETFISCLARCDRFEGPRKYEDRRIRCYGERIRY
jgi:hypothetical protein